jgi:hypothetical protein
VIIPVRLAEVVEIYLLNPPVSPLNIVYFDAAIFMIAASPLFIPQLFF